MIYHRPSREASIRFLASLIACLGLALSAVFLTWRNRLTAPLPLVRPPTYAEVGVNVALEQYDETQLELVLDRLQAAGVRWLRQRFPWDQIEPAPGRFTWETWDVVVTAAAAREMRLIAVLDGSPAWARRPEDQDNPLAPPHERADFGRFVAAFAQRYGDQLDVYQIWDEPNIAPHWGARQVDPADYLGLLREGFYQVRAVDPGAQVLLAALAPNDEPGGANLSDIAFLDQLYMLGGRAWLDGIAIEPYGFDDPPEAEGGFGRAATLRAVMERHGDEETPVWAVAFGWNALPADWQGRPSIWGQVDEVTQAAYLREAVTRARREWPWMGPMLWAALQPAVPPDDPHWGFALWTPEGTPRPAWDALTALTGAPDIVGLGTHAPDHPALRYEGAWRVTPAAADIGRTGDRLTIPFWGRGLALQVRRGPYWAYLTVTIDGQPASMLPQDPEKGAYLVLYSPAPRSEVVELANGLPLGNHEAVIEAVGGWGQWAIERVIVRGDAPPVQPWLPGALALLALLPSVALFQSLRRGEGRQTIIALAVLIGWLEDLARRVPDRALTAAVLALGLLVMLAPTSGIRLAALLALMAAWWIRLDLLPPLVMLALPFYLRPVHLPGRAVNTPELAVIAGLVILIARWLVRWRHAICSHDLSDQGQAEKIGFVFDWPIMALVAVATLAALTAREQGAAWRELRVVFIEPALFYLILTRGARVAGRPFSPWPTVDAFVVGAVLASLFGLGQYVTGTGVIEAEGVRRIRALYGSPNNLALYLDRAFPLLMAVALFGQGWRRWLYGLASAPVLMACLLTFSKGAWLLGLPAAVVVIALVGWRQRRWARQAWQRSILTAVALLAFMGLMLVPFARTERVAHLADFQSGTGFFRLRLWQSAWRMALDHPWLGVGPDNFLYAYRTRYVLPDAWGELNLSHPHNLVLDLWTRLGVIGLGVGGWLLVRAMAIGWQLAIGRLAGERAIATGLLAGLAATVAHGLIDNSIFLVDLSFVWMMILGLLAALRRAQLDLGGSQTGRNTCGFS
ncbi:MAG: O-antigen ligase family protein [Anaerolineae bacterium]|nr:O-antigen ligase family protein [Anaerolineae bacterium]MDW8098875.1 O-antigen ligase family protein [Anaerolineae bacterium]